MRMRIAPVAYVALLLLLALCPLAVDRQRAQLSPGLEAPMMTIYERFL